MKLVLFSSVNESSDIAVYYVYDSVFSAFLLHTWRLPCVSVITCSTNVSGSPSFVF